MPTYPRRVTSGTVFYIHGMGGIRPSWSDPLAELLPGATFVAPHYADLLDPDVHDPGLPSVPRIQRPTATRAPATDGDRAAYVQRQRALAAYLEESGDSVPAGLSWPGVLPHPGRLPDRLPLPRVLRSGFLGLDQVGRYLDDADRRATVLARLRAQLSAVAPPVVVLAHSLGSIVALDLLVEPPTDIDLLVTIGSPAGHAAVASGLDLASFPYDAVAGWVNVVHLLDPVPFGRGLADRFPAAHDVYLPALTGMAAALPDLAASVARAATAHLDTSYLASRTVQQAVAYGLGSSLPSAR